MIDQLWEGLQSNFGGVVTDIRRFVEEKPITTAIMAGGAAITAGGIIAATRIGKRKKATRRKARTKKGRSRDRRFRSKQKHELAYVRRKRKAGKKITRPRYKTKKSKKRSGKIYYTKKGQPYKIMASGKARFIKKTKRRTR